MASTVLSPLKALFYKASQKPYEEDTSIISIFKNKNTKSHKEISSIFS